MKANISKISLIVALGLSVIGTAHAHEDYSEGASLHWLSHVVESKSSPTANQLAPFGYAATKGADREVTLTSTSKYLNVTRLETVKINVGGKSVVWTFDTLGLAAFPLAKVIPGTDGVTVYVTENPSYQGG
ncbi:CzcE family metal-binding protein [Azonexus fungiphilus]|uniref:CzcE family metal-binding protein n=1 Tax=Azonexus fungiphilus TaxID=146940 RepID=UPI00156B4B6B|nr:CzcE family metal-binding protein [Azonexus fungiphilus]NHC08235.1 CzcE family metal-binding protein [Azonexus fungiphilus]